MVLFPLTGTFRDLEIRNTGSWGQKGTGTRIPDLGFRFPNPDSQHCNTVIQHMLFLSISIWCGSRRRRCSRTGTTRSGESGACSQRPWTGGSSGASSSSPPSPPSSLLSSSPTTTGESFSDPPPPPPGQSVLKWRGVPVHNGVMF